MANPKAKRPTGPNFWVAKSRHPAIVDVINPKNITQTQTHRHFGLEILKYYHANAYALMRTYTRTHTRAHPYLPANLPTAVYTTNLYAHRILRPMVTSLKNEFRILLL